MFLISHGRLFHSEGRFRLYPGCISGRKFDIFISLSENLSGFSYEKSGFFRIISSCRTENSLLSIVPFT